VAGPEHPRCPRCGRRMALTDIRTDEGQRTFQCVSCDVSLMIKDDKSKIAIGVVSS
jgi:tRNA(Ile2) C34 agmatinyltransferase TiaS